MAGFVAGWVYKRLGLLILLFAPGVLIHYGHMRLNSDGWWVLNLLLHLIPILPGLLLGVAFGSFIANRRGGNS
jgi:hypothetical protein